MNTEQLATTLTAMLEATQVRLGEIQVDRPSVKIDGKLVLALTESGRYNVEHPEGSSCTLTPLANAWVRTKFCVMGVTSTTWVVTVERDQFGARPMPSSGPPISEIQVHYGDNPDLESLQMALDWLTASNNPDLVALQKGLDELTK